jgi:beta-fructofuranosidase
MVIGSGLQSPQTGTVFLYKSADLLSWQLLGPLFIDQSYLNDPGVFWEVPVFWKFGSAYMLLVNKTPEAGTPARTFYWLGNFANDSFHVHDPHSQNLEVINELLSPSVNLDDQNRVVAIGIIPDLLPGSEQYNQGWAHVFSLPRTWRMVNDTLYQSPHPNLDQGRNALSSSLDNITVTPSGADYLKARGFQMEIKATIHPGSASRIGFVLEKNDNNTEYTRIYYDITNQAMVVDRSKASANPNTPRDIQSEHFVLPAGQPADWHIYIDGSVIEVFINNRWAFATRVFPASASSNKVDLFAEGGNATATGVQIWNRGDVVTGIFGPSAPVIEPLKLWPVPANKQCYIQLPENTIGHFHLVIYDVKGRPVKTMTHKLEGSQPYLIWNLQNDNGVEVPSGAYYGLININSKKVYQARFLVIR